MRLALLCRSQPSCLSCRSSRHIQAWMLAAELRRCCWPRCRSRRQCTASGAASCTAHITAHYTLLPKSCSCTCCACTTSRAFAQSNAQSTHTSLWIAGSPAALLAAPRAKPTCLPTLLLLSCLQPVSALPGLLPAGWHSRPGRRGAAAAAGHARQQLGPQRVLRC